MEKELEALNLVVQAIKDLEPSVRRRVLGYAADMFGEENKFGSANTQVASPQPATPHGTYSEFAELFAAAQPDTEKEKALVAAYWAQVVKGEGSFVSQTLNTELKHLGHGVGNITDALDRLISERPQLVLQLRKEGSTQQARKVYKLTHEGEKKVLSMINRRAFDD